MSPKRHFWLRVAGRAKRLPVLAASLVEAKAIAAVRGQVVPPPSTPAQPESD